MRTFAGDWTGTGTINDNGDAENIALDAGELMDSPVVFTDEGTVTAYQNKYDPSGDDVTLRYRHGVDEDACLIAGWNDYTVPFVSLGYVQLRVESTL